MRNVFILYIPPDNRDAMVHYQDTIVNRVPLSRIEKYVRADLRSQLGRVFGPNRIAVWGSASGSRNRTNYDSMSRGDDILIVEGDRIKLIGKIAGKTESPALSRELWKTVSGDPTTWELIYFIANPRELNLEFGRCGQLFGYKPNFQLRGFTSIAATRVKAFYQRFDDLYSILLRLQEGQPIEERSEPLEAVAPDPEKLVELEADQVDEVLQANLASDHVRMQWVLARLGLKAGERVWVPAGDQSRLRKHFHFEQFDSEFTTGIDVQKTYVENIDVVWKQEFRIGAAYEIENSTSIYSGLLRFADLNMVAPNTLYPMFVVAPTTRKNRVREQLRRPTFKHLKLDQKVRFLSYESVDEIDGFFEGADSGLTIDTIVAKSELLN